VYMCMYVQQKSFADDLYVAHGCFKHLQRIVYEYLCMCVCMYVCMYVFMYVYVCMYVCVCI